MTAKTQDLLDAAYNASVPQTSKRQPATSTGTSHTSIFAILRLAESAGTRVNSKKNGCISPNRPLEQVPRGAILLTISM